MDMNALSDQETDAFIYLNGQFPDIPSSELIRSIRSNGGNVNRCIIDLTNKQNIIKKQAEKEKTVTHPVVVIVCEHFFFLRSLTIKRTNNRMMLMLKLNPLRLVMASKKFVKMKLMRRPHQKRKSVNYFPFFFFAIFIHLLGS